MSDGTGFYRLPKDVAKRKDLPAATKLILAVLMDRVGSNGHCWPGYASLAKDLGLSRTAVIEGVDRLVSAGMISVEKRDGRSNRYEIRTSTERVPVRKPDGGQSGNRTTASTESVPELDSLNQTHVTIPTTGADGGAGLFQDERTGKGGGRRTEKEIVIPATLAAVPGFRDAWAEWIEYRKQRRLSMLPMTLNRQLKILSGEPDAVGCIEKSIANGWQGLFETKGKNHDQKQSTGPRQFEAGKQQPGKFDRKPKTVVTV